MEVVYLDNGLIDDLINNPEAVNRFDVLKVAKMIFDSQKNYRNRSSSKKCKKCSKDDDILLSTYRSIKKSIAKMSEDQKEKLKAFLKADKVVLSFRAGSTSKLTEIEF